MDLVSRLAGLITVGSLAVGCGPVRNPELPIPTVHIGAPAPAKRLVVVLPGRADDLQDLENAGIAGAVQSAWPDADVILAEVSLRYYQAGVAEKRLHDEVMLPASTRGYEKIWLGGASMGGMGTLLYDRAYPGTLDGMVLMAPYLGDRGILDEIRIAGGAAAWDPGPPQAIGPDTWQHELWRHIHDWTVSPGQTGQVWLAYGDKDRLRKAMPMLEPALPADHILVRPGGHAWKVWAPAMQEVLESVDRERDARAR